MKYFCAFVTARKFGKEILLTGRKPPLLVNLQIVLTLKHYSVGVLLIQLPLEGATDSVMNHLVLLSLKYFSHCSKLNSFILIKISGIRWPCYIFPFLLLTYGPNDCHL